jgi:hypothetical protein
MIGRARVLSGAVSDSSLPKIYPVPDILVDKTTKTKDVVKVIPKRLQVREEWVVQTIFPFSTAQPAERFRTSLASRHFEIRPG